jgi:hypothetical protein
MIGMSELYAHEDYTQALEAFNNSNHPRKWREFKNVHLKVTNNKCPICECSLEEDDLLQRANNKQGVVFNKATVDHYRPQKHYSFLTYESKNYILMCFECNSMYKGNSFPLHSTTPVRATTIEQLPNEKPLIANPIVDNPLVLFKLIFLTTPSGKKVLELIPKHEQGYSYEKALETIKSFSLGSCEVFVHQNNNVQTLRVTLLHNHFKKFEKFIEAFEKNDVNAMKSEVENKRLEQYGFFQFILRNQYVNIIPI